MAAFSVSGEARALRSLRNMKGNIDAGLMAAGHQVGNLLVKTTKDGMLSGSKSGRVYHHPKGGTYKASAPGEYPAVVSGQLLNSIKSEISGARFIRFGTTGAFNRGFDYAKHHHEKTGRPFLTMAINQTQSRVENLIGTVVYRKIVRG